MMRIGEKIVFNLSNTAKSLIKHVTIICCAFLLIFSIFNFSNILPFLFGLTFGYIFTVLKIALLEKNIKHAVELSSGKADNYMKLHFLLRYVLTAIVLAICGIVSAFALTGCVLAIISLQISAYTVNFLGENKKRKSNL